MGYLVEILIWLAFISYCASDDYFNEAEGENEPYKLPKKCGRVSISTRIIGGKRTEIGEFPWVAQLWCNLNNGGYILCCGGSLISRQHILTSAHCTQRTEFLLPPDEDIKFLELDHVRLGAYYTEPDFDEVKSWKLYIEQVFDATPPYNKFVKDFAVVKLKKKIHFTDNIQPICLPKPDMDSMSFENENVVLAGWGDTVYKEIESRPNALKKIPLKIMNTKKCKRIYDKEVPGHKALINRWVFCAKGAYGEGVCHGDSGGPLMYYREGRMYQIGIASFSYQCDMGKVPAVYTRVSEFMDWIMEMLTY